MGKLKFCLDLPLHCNVYNKTYNQLNKEFLKKEHELYI